MKATLTPLILCFLMLAVLPSLQGCNASTAEPTDANPDESNDNTAESTEWIVPDPSEKLELTDAQWRDRLTEDQYYILRQDGTEYPFTSPLDDIKHEQTPGDFAVAGCGNHVFATEHKFDSGTGWPSFDRPVAPDRVLEIPENDRWNRIEVVCARCGSHLGHVFKDGPRDTTGLRYCINGDALVFHPRPNAAHPAAQEDEAASSESANPPVE